MAVARRHPDLQFVLHHLGLPPIASGELEPWASYVRLLAGLENVAIKFSGMVTEADWNTWRAGDLASYVGHARDVFGTDRMVFGTDWPVCLMAGSYGQVVGGMVEALGPVSESERSAIFGGNAARVYRLTSAV